MQIRVIFPQQPVPCLPNSRKVGTIGYLQVGIERSQIWIEVPGGGRGLSITLAGPMSASVPLAPMVRTDADPFARVRTDLGSKESDHAVHQVQQLNSLENGFTTTTMHTDQNNSIFDSDTISQPEERQRNVKKSDARMQSYFVVGRSKLRQYRGESG